MSTVYESLRDALRAEEPVALATVTAGVGIGAKLLVRPGGEPLGTLGDPDLDRVVARDALGELEAGLTSTRHYGAHGEAREDTVSVFIESFAPPPRMVIFGAVDFTRALASVAKVLGLPRRRVRRPRGVRHPAAVPDGRRGRERVAQPLPREGRRRPRPARRGVRAHPRQQVRRARDRRFARHPRRVPRRDGVAQDARQAHRAPARGRRHRRRARPHPRTDRSRHRCPHPGGDRRVHLRRDHRGPHGPRGTALRDSDPDRSTRRRADATIDELRHRGTAGRGGGGVERARPGHRQGAGRGRRDRRHLQPVAERIDAAAAEIGPLAVPLVADVVHRGGRDRLRARGTGRARRDRHPRVQRRRAARRQLHQHTARGLPGPRSSSTASPTSRCAARRCRRCASSGGGGCWRSRRSACASPSPV